MVLKRGLDEHGCLARNEARAAANGYVQQNYIDHNELIARDVPFNVYLSIFWKAHPYELACSSFGFFAGFSAWWHLKRFLYQIRWLELQTK